MAESIQQKLTRVRPPRVKITYDVETGGAIEKVELPFIVGIFSDLTYDRMPADGDDPGNDLPVVKERKLVEIDRDNFDEVLATARPRVKLANVANVLPNPDGTTPDGASTLGGYIEFERFDDFEPMAIVDNVPALKALSAPLPQVTFCPTGGVGLGNVADYLALPNTLCVGGSWVAPGNLVARGDWNSIRTLAAEAAALPRD